MFTVPAPVRTNHRGRQVHPREPPRGTPAEAVARREDPSHGLLAVEAHDCEPQRSRDAAAHTAAHAAAHTAHTALPAERRGVREPRVPASAGEQLLVPRTPGAAASHRAEARSVGDPAPRDAFAPRRPAAVSHPHDRPAHARAQRLVPEQHRDGVQAELQGILRVVGRGRRRVGVGAVGRRERGSDGIHDESSGRASDRGLVVHPAQRREVLRGAARYFVRDEHPVVGDAADPSPQPPRDADERGSHGERDATADEVVVHRGDELVPHLRPDGCQSGYQRGVVARARRARARVDAGLHHLLRHRCALSNAAAGFRHFRAPKGTKASQSSTARA